MTFTFNGQEFDTNKRIYVLGYQIIKTWFPYNDDNHNSLMVSEYGPAVKSFYVRSIFFDDREVDGRTQNTVVGLQFDFPSCPKLRVGPGYILGHSSKECLKIYQERIKKTEC